MAVFRLLKRFRDSSPEEVTRASVTLSEAQFALAMDYGFASWPEMKKHVESVAGRPRFGRLEDLDAMNDRGIQMLLREANTKDVVLALKYAPGRTVERALKNMSAHTRKAVLDDLEVMGPVDRRITGEALAKILDVANELAVQKPELLGGGEFPMTEWESGLTKELERKPATHRSAAELIPIIHELAMVARREGLLALEGFVDRVVDDELLKLGLQMTISGRTLDLIKRLMQTKKDTMLRAYERRLDMIIAAVEGFEEGLNPAVMEQHCKTFLQ